VDVLQLIDRLEQLVTSGTRLPIASRTMIDEGAFLDIIDQLRVSVPEEIRQARRFSTERERVMEQAEAEAQKVIATAHERAMLMLQDNDLVRSATEEANRRLAEAELEAEEIRRGADQYAFEVLTSLDQELTRLLVTTRKGRATLDRANRRPADSTLHAE
jgi:vacuolar-type H+-ATPase subunit H